MSLSDAISALSILDPSAADAAQDGWDNIVTEGEDYLSQAEATQTELDEMTEERDKYYEAVDAINDIAVSVL